MDQIADEPFPRTLEGFNYGFNEYGQLRKINSKTGKPGNEPFEFAVIPDNFDYNQRHYEALGEVVNEYVYQLLETRGKLTRIVIQLGGIKARLFKFMGRQESGSSNLETFIFASSDYLSNEDKLLLLVHGSGVVRAGQWARRLIINDNLDKGTQLPFIEKAVSEGYAVIVANTNDNSRIIDGKTKLIQGSENPVNHLITVWEEVISKCPAKRIAIVAHSYGGVCTLELAKRVPNFTDRVFAIAMTDSVHSMVHHSTDGSLLTFLQKVGRNWVSSGQPLNEHIETARNDIERVSAGHTQHEMTSFCSMSSIFEFFRTKLTQ